MPIFVYECPEGHKTEFLKLKEDDEEPQFCEHIVYITAHYTDYCGLPLTKTVPGASLQWKRGKNPNWPL